ncbi:hypothetical protein QR680_002963 [Steinernema hermaphroditum]|uniref:Uncharacterized protein n=1 Tax=Steinernema hermaphroditum TaxID=289476 RepID=A0AA39LJ63_9BILA|nr:hypothetical protein QR680_002963 [Steinernema hermaphroditum]
MGSLSPLNNTENICSPTLPSPPKRVRIMSATICKDVVLQEHKVSREERARCLGSYPGFRGCTVWFTGLSGAGKTTIAFGVEKILIEMGIQNYCLDGDNVRHGLCKNLGFSASDRSENIRRVAETAKILADSGSVALASFISPFKNDREEAKEIHKKGRLPFFEIYVNTSLEICEKRDPKKLYKRARAGKIPEFTGIDSAYEAPETPDLVVNAGIDDEEACVQKVLEFLNEKGIIPDEAMTKFFGIPLTPLLVENESEVKDYNSRAAEMPKIELGEIDVQWLQCLFYGQLLDTERDCTVPSDGSIQIRKDGLRHEPMNQSVPIVLPIDASTKSAISLDGSLAKEIALIRNGEVLAILCDPEVYPHRKNERVCRTYGTNDNRHPGVKQVLDSGDWLLGGDLKVLKRIVFNDGLDEYRKTPAELRKRFSEAECDVIFAFQLRNPIHNGHALLMKHTRDQLLQRYKNPMLLLHPLGGWTKDDDVPLPVRIQQHLAVLEEGVLDQSWTELAIFPSPMLYAGPTEVQWHARARLAAGVNAYIVGRDPAGIQDPANPSEALYDVTHGAKVLSMAPGLPELEIIPFKVAAYDKKNGCMAFIDKDRSEDFVSISGTKMRGFARNGEEPPQGFMAPKAWKVLSSYYQSLNGNASK